MDDAKSLSLLNFIVALFSFGFFIYLVFSNNFIPKLIGLEIAGFVTSALIIMSLVILVINISLGLKLWRKQEEGMKGIITGLITMMVIFVSFFIFDAVL